MSCGVHEAAEMLENELWRRWSNVRVGEWTFPSFHLHHSSFSNPYFAFPTSQALHLRYLASRPWFASRSLHVAGEGFFSGFSCLSGLKFHCTAFAIIISLIIMCFCDGASGVVNRHPCLLNTLRGAMGGISVILVKNHFWSCFFFEKKTYKMGIRCVCVSLCECVSV